MKKDYICSIRKDEVTDYSLKEFICESLEEVKQGGTLQQYEFLKALNDRFNVYPNFPSWEELGGGK